MLMYVYTNERKSCKHVAKLSSYYMNDNENDRQQTMVKLTSIHLITHIRFVIMFNLIHFITHKILLSFIHIVVVCCRVWNCSLGRDVKNCSGNGCQATIFAEIKRFENCAKLYQSLPVTETAGSELLKYREPHA